MQGLHTHKSHPHLLLTRTMLVHQHQVRICPWQSEKEGEPDEDGKEDKDNSKRAACDPGLKTGLLPFLPLN